MKIRKWSKIEKLTKGDRRECEMVDRYVKKIDFEKVGVKEHPVQTH